MGGGKAQLFTLPWRGRVGQQGRSGVRTPTFENFTHRIGIALWSHHPTPQFCCDPPPPGEGKEKPSEAAHG
jgi:hypothetical protein